MSIGAAGGMVKAGTEYAFSRIQRDSADIAESLVRHGHPFATQRHGHGTSCSTPYSWSSSTAIQPNSSWPSTGYSPETRPKESCGFSMRPIDLATT
jgi:hypothetical protein